LSKADAAIDDWIKGIAPNTGLRQWFGHDPKRRPEFQRRYRAELQQHTQELDRIRALAKTQKVILIYSAHDEEHNDAIVLREVLMQQR
jgi:uncharacterized protein YeaO (DUF488 family)